MATIVKVGETKTRLSELLARVEKGEEFIIARGNEKIARLMPERDRKSRLRLIATMRAERDARRSVTRDEIRAWREEGRR